MGEEGGMGGEGEVEGARGGVGGGEKGGDEEEREVGGPKSNKIF